MNDQTRQVEGPARKLLSEGSRRISSGIEKARKADLDRENLVAYMLPREEEPPRINEDDFRRILMSCVLTGASDVTLQTDQQPRAEINGVLYRISRHAWSASEIDLVLVEIYRGAHAQTEIKSQRALDFSYELNLADGSKQRFRVNATGIFGRDGFGVEITMRVLPAITPDMISVGLSLSEMAALTPRDGLVVIAGATGSGKSTTMAAVTRAHLENSERTVKIVDIQAPIEYTYRDVRLSMTGSSSMIGQSEIGKHLKTFADGVHSALRRKPHIINVGEARDFATISASLEACLTGHLVYTTTHAGSVSETMRRLLSTFPANERESRAYDLVSGLRFVMVQHLVPRIDRPGRVAIREYLRFTDRVREKLLSSPMQSWPSQLTQEVSGLVPDVGSEDMRMCLTDVAARRFQEGMISRSDALQIGGAQAVVHKPGEIL